MGKIIFAGDTVLREGTDGKRLTEDILQNISDFDFFCCNIESPAFGVEDRTNRLGITFCFNNIRELARGGINIGVLGNNHIMDCGQEGLLSTLEQCKEYGIKTVGASLEKDKVYEPIIVKTADNITVAIFSFEHRYYYNALEKTDIGVADIHDNRVVEQILEIRDKVDFIVVNAHCGCENQRIPFNNVRKKYKFLIDIGADLIIGHHPHVIQGIEEYKGKKIAYSLGNFAFDLEEKYIETVPETWWESMALEVDFFKNHTYMLKCHLGEYSDGKIHVCNVMDELPLPWESEEEYEREYHKILVEEFKECIQSVRQALRPNIPDYVMLHHYLALEEQSVILQEALEYMHRSGVTPDDAGEWTLNIRIKPVVIWGTGKNGQRMYMFLKQRGFQILAMVDGLCKKKYSIEIGDNCIDVFSPSELKELEQDYVIIIASVYKDKIGKAILDLGICREYVCDEDVYEDVMLDEQHTWRYMDWNYDAESINKFPCRCISTTTLMEDGPVVVLLHGAGSCGNNNMGQIIGMGNAATILAELSKSSPCELIVPQCPYCEKWIDIDYKTGGFNIENLAEKQNIDFLIQDIERHYPGRKIRLVGFSLGAYASWYILHKYPELVDRAVIISGGGDSIHISEKLQTQIILIHGSDDQIVPAEASRRMYHAYPKNVIKYIEIGGMGHQLLQMMDKKMLKDTLTWILEM